MPVMPSSVGVATFNAVISQRLANLSEELAGACEAVSNEQQRQLWQENQELRKENAELRGKLANATGAVPQEAKADSPRKSNDTPMKANACTDTELDVDRMLAEDKLKMQESGTSIKLPVKITPVEPDSNSPLKTVPERQPVDLADVDAAIEDGEIMGQQDSTRIAEFTLLPELAGSNWSGHPKGLNHDLSMVDTGYAHREEEQRAAAMSTRFALDPGSQGRLAWDLTGIPILSWDLITIPLQVFDMGRLGSSVMSTADWVTLLYWSIDIPMSFVTGYYDLEGNPVMHLPTIARHYVRGAFPLDTFIVGADWLGIIIGAIGSGDASFLANFAILRVLRISRFMRLLRLRKLQGKLQQLEDLIDNEWILVLLNLLSKIFSILIVNHYMGCMWYWIGSQPGFGDREYRWLSALPYPQYDSKSFGPPEWGGQRLNHAPWAMQYATCLHWALAQITPGPNNIQPQNVCERMFAVVVLLFGMIIFSSFVASVTQARMQMAKMMSKFERDFWLLRKFCRQHKISTALRGRMKRYIDFVLVPAQQRLNIPDIALIPKLSPHLRLQLFNEMNSQSLIVHPFFQHLMDGNQSVMDCVCSETIIISTLARGDVAFASGQVAKFMYIIIGGFLDYIPVTTSDRHSEECVHAGHWVSEAALWTKWMHQGQLQASIEGKAMMVEAPKLREVLLKNGGVMPFVRQYGNAFCRNMSKDLCNGMPTDLQEAYATSIVTSDLSRSHSMVFF